jgi:hypothetical protein
MSAAQDPHKRYERKQMIWLFFSFFVIGLMAAGVMIYGAVMSGMRRGRR